MNRIIYKGITVEQDNIFSGSVHVATSLSNSALESNTFTADIKDDTETFLNFDRNDQIVWQYGDRQEGIFYLQEVEEIAYQRYMIYATSAIGLLIESKHYGGIYTGISAKDLILELCQSIPVMVQTKFQNVKLYGWLPYASARDNFLQVLIAIGAWIKTDLNGVLRVESLWDGESGCIDPDRLFSGTKIPQETKVTKVIVTEHQFIESDEETTVLSGTLSEESTIRFDEPLHSLRADGFTIMESGANYVRLSAGNGNVYGKTYIHKKREVSERIFDSRDENVKTLENATLVSLVNSRQVTKRIADYYRSQSGISAYIPLKAEKPGNVQKIYNPYKKQYGQFCIESIDTNLSVKLKSSVSGRIGFIPPESDTTETVVDRIVLTGSGKWTKPAGADFARYVMISAGQGGYCGGKGEDGGEAPSVSWTSSFDDRYSGKGLAPIAKGGLGGLPGAGGRILEGELDLTDISEISYSCGIGGNGSAYNADGTPGELGTDTVFGNLTTASAPAPEMGYTDPTTGERFGGIGKTGLPGGDGAGKAEDVQGVDEETARNFDDAAGSYDEDGNFYPGGPTEAAEGQPGMINMNIYRSDDGNAYLWLSPGLGSGGAAGASGTSGGSETHNIGSTSVSGRSGAGADGATPTLTPKKPTTYGKGGTGGYGGGAGGSAGLAIGTSGNGATFEANAGTPGIGGDGSPGGPGADGCIILFVTRTITRKRGAVVTSDGKWMLDKLGRRIVV